MTTLDNLTLNLKTFSLKQEPFQKLQDLKKNNEWVISVNNSILEAKEMKDFFLFYTKDEIINFFSIHNIIFTTYLEMFFYEGWEKEYKDLQILNLVILKSHLESYCLLNPISFSHVDDIVKTIKLIIYIYTEILSIINS